MKKQDWKTLELNIAFCLEKYFSDVKVVDKAAKEVVKLIKPYIRLKEVKWEI